MTPRLSVMIAAHSGRAAKLAELLAVLLPQAEAAAGQVEVIAAWNHGDRYLAWYRQMLLDAAAGQYLAFADDDDLVDPGYVAALLAAAASGPDCVTFDMDVPNGCAQDPAAHVRSITLAHDGWRTREYDWTPQCPVRADLARAGAWWPWQGEFGEDQNYAAQIRPGLLTEVHVPRVLYTYRWDPADSCQTALLAAGPDAPPPVDSPAFRWLAGDALTV